MKYLDDVPLELISSNAINEEHPAWDNITEYPVDILVIDNDTIYKSKQQNSNKQPHLYPLYWKDMGAINSKKMLDQFINSQSIADDLEFTIMAGGWCDTLALFNVAANSITITQDTFTYLQTLVDISILDWGDYFINNFEQRNDVLIKIPLLVSGQITIKLFGLNAKLGAIVAGRLVDVGATLLGAKPGFDDYSKITTDEDGLTSYSEGKFSKRGSYVVSVDTNSIDTVVKRFLKRRGKMTCYIGDDSGNLEIMMLYGFVSTFEPIVENEVSSEYTLELKGVT